MRRHAGAYGGRGGFTMAEVLITLLIFTMVIGTILFSYVGYQRAFLVATSHIGVRNDIRIALDTMTRDIRWAVEPVASHGSYSNSSTCLVLKVPSTHPRNAPTPTPAGAIINVGTTHDYIVYRRNGTDLERIIDANDSVATERTDGTSVIARNIQSLAFTLKDRNNVTTAAPSGAYAVQVALTAARTVRAMSDTSATEHLATTVAFRNSTARPTPAPTP